LPTKELSPAHSSRFRAALGEFGATILLAGNIPGETQTLSLAIYNFVQLGKDPEAYTLLGITVALAFLFVWCSEWLLRTGKKRKMLLALPNSASQFRAEYRRLVRRASNRDLRPVGFRQDDTARRHRWSAQDRSGRD
jgi:hypothetical protein